MAPISRCWPLRHCGGRLQPTLRGITKPIRPSINEAFRIQPLYWPSQLIFGHAIPQRFCRNHARICPEWAHRCRFMRERHHHKRSFDPLEPADLEGVAIPQRVTSALKLISVSRDAYNNPGMRDNIELWRLPFPWRGWCFEHRHQFQLSCAEANCCTVALAGPALRCTRCSFKNSLDQLLLHTLQHC